MKLFNHQFGELEIEEKHLLNFPDGLIGFEQNRQFIIVDDENSEPFRWLVSAEDSDLSFPLIDPSLIVGGYGAKLEGSADVTMFVVAALSERPEDSTVNLRSPIIIENKTGTGRQIVIEDEGLSMQYRFITPSAENAK